MLFLALRVLGFKASRNERKLLVVLLISRLKP